MTPSSQLHAMASWAGIDRICDDSDVVRFVQGGVVKTFRWLTQSLPMSVPISIAPTSEDIWIIRNAVYRWLVARVADVHDDQPDVVEQLTFSGYNGGISLDTHLSESPELAHRIVDSLRSTIDHIRAHAVPLTDDSGEPWPELQSQVYASLDELRLLLDRFSMATDP